MGLLEGVNLRAAFDVWPPGAPLPTHADDVARGAFQLTLREQLAGRGANMEVVRFSHDGVTLWKLDGLPGIELTDFVRAIVRVFTPQAFAVAVVQPLRAPGDPTVRGVHCLAAYGDEVAEVKGAVDHPDAPPDVPRTIPRWEVRHGRFTEEDSRWIGPAPRIDLELPMLDAGEA